PASRFTRRHAMPDEHLNAPLASISSWRTSTVSQSASFRSGRTRHLVDAMHRLVERVALEHVGFESGRGLEPAVRLNHAEQPQARAMAVQNLIALEARAAADDRDPIAGRARDEVAPDLGRERALGHERADAEAVVRPGGAPA